LRGNPSGALGLGGTFGASAASLRGNSLRSQGRTTPKKHNKSGGAKKPAKKAATKKVTAKKDAKKTTK